MEIGTDALAYWYFRLNGFLTIVNFVVHLERRRETGTDVDILGVRFPFRAELFEQTMIDDKAFRGITSRPYIIIAEVKRGLCNLNGPWTTRERRNLDRVLRAVGAFPMEDVEEVAEHLYSDGIYKNSDYYVSLCCIGQSPNRDIRRRYPQVPQLTWDDVRNFIYKRFKGYRKVKSWHQHWDDDGQNLWDTVESCNTREQFLAAITLVS